MSRKTCPKCGIDVPYQGSKHDGSELCRTRVEHRKIAKRKLIVVSPRKREDMLHTSVIAVCKILGLDYTLVPSSVRAQPWVCVTPDVEETLRAVYEVAHSVMIVVPEAARRLVYKRDVLAEFDALRRLGADGLALFDHLALAGIAGERAQFEARCIQRNPKRSDLSIRRAWAKFKLRRARKLKSKSKPAERRL